MKFNIDLPTIKNSLLSAYHVVIAQSRQWLGRGITLIKSGVTTAVAPPYLQDRRIAVISLIALNIFVLLMIDLFNPHKNDLESSSGIQAIIEIGAYVGTTIVFAKFAQLPLHWIGVTGISLAVAVSYAFFVENIKPRIANKS